jgi:hypothetical protein
VEQDELAETILYSTAEQIGAKQQSNDTRGERDKAGNAERVPPA